MLSIPLRPDSLMAPFLLATIASFSFADDNSLTPDELAIVERAQSRRIEAIEKVIGSVIAIYGEEKQGGGSGVIIAPSGIGLTNHHVIMGAGVQGWGGLADGKMYRWKLIGTDPGGDVAIIQMEGLDEFPYATLGDSDLVQPGDWSLAMGNPFVLTEDQSPTVTLGIVSGVKRYQPGAGLNQLVYGNCIQTDSSINPGNSGGPLFNMQGEVIGINGRGSFKERGRVNVGLGYAISSNQIKNFIPELLATKLVEHGTLDANFEDRDGKVLCSNVYEDSNLYQQGIRPGDELLEFEGIKIKSANQFTNLICTLPEDWPAVIKLRKADGQEKTVYTRLYGLPYKKPKPSAPRGDGKPTPEEEEKRRRMQDMAKLLAAKPGTVRKKDINSSYAKKFLTSWVNKSSQFERKAGQSWTILYDSSSGTNSEIKIQLTDNGRFKIDVSGEIGQSFEWDGIKTTLIKNEESKELSLIETKLCPLAVQTMGMIAANGWGVFDAFGEALLDGSDRANGSHCIRFRLTDDEDDPFFIWLSMDHLHSDRNVELIKAGASLNCDQSPGGVLFEDWKVSKGIRIPGQVKVIRNLNEKIQQSYQLKSVSVSDNDGHAQSSEEPAK